VARAAVLGRLTWRLGEVVDVADETPRVRSIRLAVPDWPGHRPGQHVDVRLTAEDGYQAQRSYSIASAPEAEHVQLTVERLDEGEVSPYLADELRTGDLLEIRGPIGGYFVWEARMGGPLFLVAGGSGVVPLMAMLRHRAAVGSSASARMLYSSRSPEDVIYGRELERLAASGDGLGVAQTLTRRQPPGWAGYSRRIDAAMLEEAGWPADDNPAVYICGPTPLVEAVAGTLVELGHEPARIKTERFGPTGGRDG
jgi:ferredoxin-NADP reductase